MHVPEPLSSDALTLCDDDTPSDGYLIKDMSARVPPPLWKCSSCARRFANRNQTHACGRYTMTHHLGPAPPEVRAIYKAFVRHVRECGRVVILPEKTRIAFQVRMSFAAVRLGRSWLDGHLVLDRPTTHRHFRKVETFSPRNHVHHFRLTAIDQLDREFDALLRAAYSVGEQRHLHRRP